MDVAKSNRGVCRLRIGENNLIIGRASYLRESRRPISNISQSYQQAVSHMGTQLDNLREAVESLCVRAVDGVVQMLGKSSEPGWAVLQQRNSPVVNTHGYERSSIIDQASEISAEDG